MRGLRTLALGAVAGFLIAFSLPPWGWWPLGLAGFALFDHTGFGATVRGRFMSGWAAGMVWLAMGELWMFDLTAPGYAMVFIVFGAGYGVINVLAGDGEVRLLTLPAGFVLYEWLRWSWPFGGVPLATVPMTQVDSVLNRVLPLGGSLLLTAVTVLAGCAIRAAFHRRFDLSGMAMSGVLLTVIAGVLAPGASVIGELDVAVVQGGGPQRTRADTCENQRVFDRHRQATETIDRAVDLIMWPENVVNPTDDDRSLGPCDDLLFMSEAIDDVADIARSQNAVLIPGWFHSAEAERSENTVNYSTAVTTEGETVSRYDKVRTVPFGEFVPLRGLIERFNSEIPNRDVIRGTGPAVLNTPVGNLGISISWEVFFDSRGRAAIRDGGEVLLNPTNGSSYWLTILQSQQIASSRLRAMENDRWVLQAAPTGFSGIINPDGEVLDRTNVSEQRVLYATIERREGLTLATRLGATPALLIAACVLVGAQFRAQREVSLDRR